MLMCTDFYVNLENININSVKINIAWWLQIKKERQKLSTEKAAAKYVKRQHRQPYQDYFPGILGLGLQVHYTELSYGTIAEWVKALVREYRDIFSNPRLG